MAMDKWTNEFLDEMRQVGDAPADAVVQALFASGQVTAVNELMQTLVRNDMPPPAALPPVVRDYFEQTDDLPEWADVRLIQEAEELFGRYGLQIILILNCYSLPLTYAMQGVRVLYDTARLYTNPRRRVLETAQMIIDVMQPGGLERGGYGVRSAQKVRLMHAAVRHLLPAQGWDDRLGVPINQEDLAGTLLSFSALVLDGLQKLGVDLTAAETAAYLHGWNVVGHIMGVRSELLARDIDEANALMNRIIQRQFKPSQESKAMLTTLVEFLEYTIPGNLFDGIPVSMMRFFLGSERATSLELAQGDWTTQLIRPLRFLTNLADDVGDEVTAVAKLSSFLGYKLLEGMIWIERGGERSQFHIPQELKECWGM